MGDILGVVSRGAGPPGFVFAVLCGSARAVRMRASNVR